MIVTCPNCEARYAVDPLAIGPAGRTVQCARCNNRWYQKVESPRTAPDVVIRPLPREVAAAATTSTLPVPVPPKSEPPPWRRAAALVAGVVVVLALGAASYHFRDDIQELVSRGTARVKSMTASAVPAAKPPTETPAPSATKTEPKAEATPAPTPAAPPASASPAATSSTASSAAVPPPDKAQLDVDVKASKVELVDGKYVVHGQIVNTGKAEGSTRGLKFIFKKDKDVIGEKSYPLVLGPIAPGARLDFTQTLDDPPAGATEIVPAVE